MFSSLPAHEGDEPAEQSIICLLAPGKMYFEIGIRCGKRPECEPWGMKISTGSIRETNP